MSQTRSLERLLDKLERFGPLAEVDRRALLALPTTFKAVDAGTTVTSEGEPLRRCAVLLRGFAYRHRTLTSGARQVIAIHVPGDIPDLRGALLGQAVANTQMLTPGEIAFVPVAALRRLTRERPDLLDAFWHETLIDASISSEWLANIGRRDAHARIAHLLCEFITRLRAAGISDEHGYELPMTQEQIADATGLTAVHVNRTLQRMRKAGLIHGKGRSISSVDWRRLSEAADFDTNYLQRTRVSVAPGIAGSRRGDGSLE